jgi:acyl-CoA synthetase (AMP-forming)/AMP-acid ligase II
VDQPVFPEYSPTLGNAIEDCAAKYGERLFLIGPDSRLTYAEADRESLRLAQGLLALGVGKGTRVAILMPNSPDWVLSWFAAGRIGALSVPISTLFQPRELAWVLRHADIDTLLVQASYAGHDYLDRLERTVPGLAEQRSAALVLASHPYLRRIVVWGDCDRGWALRGPQALHAAAAAQPAVDAAFARAAQSNVTPADELIAICTSGTTAEQKVVVHSHGSAVRTTHSYRAYRGITSEVRDFAAMPFFWLGGLNVHLLPCMFEGASIVFARSPATEDILEAVLKEKVTRLRAWVVQKAALFESARARGVDLAYLDPEPRDAQGKVIPPRLRVGSLLGMTESFGPHGVEKSGRALPEERAYSQGHAIAGIDRRIVDPETRAVLPPGQVGELQIRGYSLMQGYYKRERAEVFGPDGWFSTGDLCSLDADGYLYFNSRLSDMIKTMGANVSPREVEVALQALPGVSEAIVLGVPDAQRGETVIAVAVPKTGATLDPAALRARLKDEISSYKVPAEIFVAEYEQVPRTEAGKPKKKQLAALLPEWRAQRGAAPAANFR